MLPTGHVAAGFLTAFGVIKVLKPELDVAQANQLLLLGAGAGFAPDLDEFWFFFKNRTWLVAGQAAKDRHHRKYLSHAPILWVLPCVVIYFLVSSEILKLGVLIFLLASLSHFILDSLEFGIMWLWPINTKIYALAHGGQNFIIEQKNFFKHSFQFLRLYTTRISFYLEVLIILLALIVYWLY